MVRSFYLRLADAGRAAKVALIARMRKLLAMLNVFLKHRAQGLNMIQVLKEVLSGLRRSADLAIGVASGRPIKEAARLIQISGDPTSLNIEMYQRFKPVADRINALAEGRLTVLDVGGRGWTFSAFLPRHRVTVADLETTGIDARVLPYQDCAFDVATAHHLLEHVPPADRLLVMAELVRVARTRVFVTGPFEENLFAREIDELLVRLQPDNRYLQEHARLSLPSLKEIEMWLAAEGLRYRVEPLTRCSTWLLALVLTSLQGIRPREFREVTRYYNQRFSGLDRSDPAYQTLLEIEVDS